MMLFLSNTATASDIYTLSLHDALPISDLVLPNASTLSGGSICMHDDGGGDPSLQINSSFTIAASAANNTPFNCSSGASGPFIFVSSTGSFIDNQAGDTYIDSPLDNDGT